MKFGRRERPTIRDWQQATAADDPGGSAGVREPRRPAPQQPPATKSAEHRG
jgi:hypothetical protein